MTYYLKMRDDGNCEEMGEIQADNLKDALAQIPAEANNWCSDGEWGDDGAAIGIQWSLYSDEGCTAEIDNGITTVEIAPNHDVLISAAGGDTDCEHDWTSEGEGGCAENPGVWSTGGTSMRNEAHCRRCGLHRTEHTTGSQRNLGEHDTVEYEQPQDWCKDCGHVIPCECE